MESLVLWGIILLVGSLALVILEVFVPSAGLISLLAAAVGIGGLACLYKYDWMWGLIATLVMLILAPLTFFAGMNVMPSTPMGKRMLFGEEGEDRPAISDEPNVLAAMVGKSGEAVTDLRPVGMVRVDGVRLQARSETALIQAGASIRVTGVDGPVIKVRRADS